MGALHSREDEIESCGSCSDLENPANSLSITCSYHFCDLEMDG